MAVRIQEFVKKVRFRKVACRAGFREVGKVGNLKKSKSDFSALILTKMHFFKKSWSHILSHLLKVVNRKWVDFNRV